MSVAAVQMAIVIVLVFIVFFGLARRYIAQDVAGMVAVGTLLVTGILDIDDVLGVFSNPAPVTVGCILVLSTALVRTGVIDAFGQALVHIHWRRPPLAMIMMAIVVSVISAFVSNTPLVVILTPLIIALAHRMEAAPSRFLIPLSYAAIFGGTCTLVGTSSTIIVDGIAQAHAMEPFQIFELTAVGIVMAAVGILYLALVGSWALPSRQTLADALINLPQRQYLAEVLVPANSPLVGRTLTDAGLTRTKGVHVIDVIREEMSFDPEHGQPTLRPGDRLVIRTKAKDMKGLRDEGGLVISSPDEHVLEPITSRSVVMMEGIVGPNSRFVGQRVGDLNLRRLYGTYILAIHRQNEALHGNFDRVRLAFGDTLLLEGPAEGLKRLFETQEMVNLSEVDERPFRRAKAPIAVIAMTLVLSLAALNALPLAGLALAGATAVIAFGCVDVDEAYQAIDWRMIILILGMLALSLAMEQTGAMALIIEHLASVLTAFGPVVVLSLLYAVTSILTETTTNNAVAILMAPFAIGLANEMGVDPRPFLIAVIFAAAASFATPLGYKTNAFVYTAGGYRYSDFLKIGIPLSILNWAAATVLIPLFWPLG
ncbi:MAG: SLC13 family permease [Hyphomicrobiales bacterium]|nr:SLC13 family permease [Hyphomicrobiales bacterium]